MSQRYHHGGTYQTRNPLAARNPLRSIPLFQPASILLRPAVMPPQPTLPAPKLEPLCGQFILPSVQDLIVRTLANAEAALRDAVHVYDAARAGIGEANRRVLPSSTPAFILAQMRTPPKPIVLSDERIP